MRRSKRNPRASEGNILAADPEVPHTALWHVPESVVSERIFPHLSLDDLLAISCLSRDQTIRVTLASPACDHLWRHGSKASCGDMVPTTLYPRGQRPPSFRSSALEARAWHNVVNYSMPVMGSVEMGSTSYRKFLTVPGVQFSWVEEIPPTFPIDSLPTFFRPTGVTWSFGKRRQAVCLLWSYATYIVFVGSWYVY
jgi:hypothetical protein